MDVEYLVRDMFEAVRPKTKIHESKEQADKAADQLDQEFRHKLGTGIKNNTKNVQDSMELYILVSFCKKCVENILI